MTKPVAHRTDFCLVRGPAIPAERFATLRALAARIHELRADRAITLKSAQLAAGGQQPEGHCVGVNAADDSRVTLIGYAFFPETLSFAAPKDRVALADALRALVPDAHAQLGDDILSGEAA
ncbi:MAG TPA: hypothetical protein VMU59_06690 [Caulobacteraceae bacterium]|nr:hypothetical protein [Caulobacteraceae bacterium]